MADTHDTIYALLQAAHHGRRRVRITTAQGTAKGYVGKIDAHDDRMPFRIDERPQDCDGGLWVGLGDSVPSVLRVVSAEVIDQPKPAGDWFTISSIDDARILEGEILEVDASRVAGLANIHGLRGRVYTSGPALCIRETGTFQDHVCVWCEPDKGVRFRYVSKCDQVDDGWIEVTTLEQARALDGKTVEVDASNVPTSEWPWEIHHYNGKQVRCVLDQRQGYAILQAVVAGTPTLWLSDGSGPSRLRLRVVQPSHSAMEQAVNVCVAKAPAPSACQPAIAFDPSATFRDAGMRPELVAALARQTEQPQPTSKVCPDCKGAGTQLLTSACPTCKGSCRVPVVPDSRFAYALLETRRDGDQLWAINIGSVHHAHVLTMHDHCNDGGRPNVMRTTVSMCDPTGRHVTRGHHLPGSFLGEHHGERAVAGYVEHLNRSAGR